MTNINGKAMMKNVICVGELLIDFICSDVNSSLVEGNNFIKKAGGAPANVAATVSKLGGKAQFIGKVGADPFGHFLKNVLIDAGVDTKGVVFDAENPTTLAFVSLKDDGERDFIFNRGADGELSLEDINIDLQQQTIYHFGSATALLPGKTHSTYLSLIKNAAQQSQFVSFDPNYRDALWDDMSAFIQAVYACLSNVDLLKVSEEELVILGDSEDKHIALAKLHELGCRFICVTLGSKGTLISSHKDNSMSQTTGQTKIVPSIKITSIDSTGAGDAFIGAVLYQLSQQKDTVLDIDKLSDIVSFANKVGALVCTQLGAISSIPSLKQVEELAIDA